MVSSSIFKIILILSFALIVFYFYSGKVYAQCPGVYDCSSVFGEEVKECMEISGSGVFNYNGSFYNVPKTYVQRWNVSTSGPRANITVTITGGDDSIDDLDLYIRSYEGFPCGAEGRCDSKTLGPLQSFPESVFVKCKQPGKWKVEVETGDTSGCAPYYISVDVNNFECCYNSDCPPGEICENGYCTPGCADPGGGCSESSQCCSDICNIDEIFGSRCCVSQCQEDYFRCSDNTVIYRDYYCDSVGGCNFQQYTRDKRKPDSNGYIRNWLMLGMFNDIDCEGCSYPWLIPKNGCDNWFVFASANPKGGDKLPTGHTWFIHHSGDASIDLDNEVFEPGVDNNDVTAFAFANIESPNTRTVRLSLQYDDSITVWLNGVSVLDRSNDCSSSWNSDVTLNQGSNRLLIRVGENTGAWSFNARFLDPITNNPITDVNISLPTSSYDCSSFNGRVSYNYTSNLGCGIINRTYLSSYSCGQGSCIQTTSGVTETLVRGVNEGVSCQYDSCDVLTRYYDYKCTSGECLSPSVSCDDLKDCSYNSCLGSGTFDSWCYYCTQQGYYNSTGADCFGISCCSGLVPASCGGNTACCPPSSWVNSSWSYYPCFRNRTVEYREYQCPATEGGSCPYVSTIGPVEEREYINEGLACGVGNFECLDECKKGKKLSFCQSGDCVESLQYAGLVGYWKFDSVSPPIGGGTLPYPPDKDSWTENSASGWTTSKAIVSDIVESKIGSYSINFTTTGTYGWVRYDFNKDLSSYDMVVFWLKTNGGITSQYVEIKSTGGTGNKRAYRYLNPASPTSWTQYGLYFSSFTKDGIDWTTASSIRFEQSTANTTDLIDGLHFEDESLYYTLDETPNHNDGLLKSDGVSCFNEPDCIQLVGGKIDNALKFDGVDDYVNVSDHPSLGGMSQLTVEAWIKLDQLPSERGTTSYMFYKRHSVYPPSSSYWFYITTGNGLGFGVANESAMGATAGTGNPLLKNVWYHVAGVYNGTQVKLYVNGLPNGWWSSLRGRVFDSDSPLYIGYVSPYAFPGAMDDAKIYNYALTDEEILQRYKEGSDGYQSDASYCSPFSCDAQSSSGCSFTCDSTCGAPSCDNQSPYSSCGADSYCTKDCGCKVNCAALDSSTCSNYPDECEVCTGDGTCRFKTGGLPLTTDTVALWHLGEGSGQTVFDESPNSNDGTLGSTSGSDTNDPTWVADTGGSSLKFDAVDDYVVVNDHPSLGGMSQLTVEAWIKLDQLPSDMGKTYGTIVIKPGAFSLRVTLGGYITLTVTNETGYTVWPSTGYLIKKNIWYHVAAVYDGSMARIYVNGFQYGGTPQRGNVNDSSYPLYMSYTYSSYIMNGSIDEVKILNRALTPLEILADYLAGRTHPIVECQPGPGGCSGISRYCANSCGWNLCQGTDVSCGCDTLSGLCQPCSPGTWCDNYICKTTCDVDECESGGKCYKSGTCEGGNLCLNGDWKTLEEHCDDGSCLCENANTCPQDCSFVDYQLREGWNLISLPYKRIVDLTLDECNAEKLPFFYWEKDVWKKVIGISNIEGGYGYWTNPDWFVGMESKTCWINASVNIGEDITANDIPMIHKGYNEIGAPRGIVNINNIKGTCEIVKGPFYWSARDNQWLPTGGIVEEKKGYWIYVENETCKLGA